MRKLFYNGYFITLENQEIEALLIEDGIIKKTGTKEEIIKYQDDKTEIIDLKGKTMMPSFIDAHSHFSGVANNFLKVNLEECKNFKEIQEKLLGYKKENDIKDNEWIIASGYDNNSLEEKEHPRKNILDEILPNNPVVLQHKSGHVGVFNSKALENLKITENTVAPEGGVIEKIDGKVTGYMEENAFIECQKKLPMPDFNKLIESYEKAQEKYLSYGITTVQEGMTYTSMIPIYKELINKNKLIVDLVSYIEINNRKVFFEEFKNNIKKYENNFKIGGYKIFLDGSPQSRTAWMRTPYIGDSEYYGYGTMKDEEVENAINVSIDTNMQILAHCNGDKAAEQYIRAIKKYNNEMKKLRPVMIHAQLLGTDQIKEVKKYNIIPSFFIAHVFYWGDIHISNFGMKRASKISPAGSSLKENVLFTFHQDAPVIEPNMFETIWCAVYRKTKEGVKLGKEEEISVLDAIKAVTINAAYQYFEEDQKGSIKEGKFADLIILDKNPLKVDLEDIKNIKILETIKRGKTLSVQC